jgi:hypothetical protein
MSLQTIKLSTAPNQKMTVQLTVDGQPLTLGLTLSYMNMAGYWSLGVSDVNGNLLIASVPLLTGAYPSANLLAQYGYLKIGSAYVLNAGTANTDYPNNSNLQQFTLIWGDTEQ